ncbi:hypothetical protein GF356_04295, partial [candidate division GN15 bacterium]|nr:hypothetical protein [candidate division GN15 bacterium]
MRTLSSTFIVALIACSLLVSGCVYYNTFYNARTAFDEAEDLRKDSPPDQPRIDQNNYRRAIEKSQKVVENHPNSKWYDDAVWIIGVSYFHLEEYSKAER